MVQVAPAGATVGGTRGELGHLRVGIAGGRALCGNMGSAKVKMFVMLGEAVGYAVVLQKFVAKQLECGIVIAEDIARQVYLPISVTILIPTPTHLSTYLRSCFDI